jgi:hypothetical protein
MATEVVKNKDGSYTVTTSSGSSRVSGNTVTTISGSGAYGSTTPKPSSPTPTPTAPKPSSGGGGNTNQTVSDPVKYDPYTGKVLPTGGSFVDQNTGKTIYQGGSLSGQLSGLISTDTLTNTPENMKAEIPTMPQIDYSKYIPTTINTETDPMKAYEANSQANFQTYLQGLIDNELPSAEDSYARAQKESGILKAQQQVNDLTGQLNQIVAQGQASQLQVVGQGRGIPEAIIGGQQAQIARETAIRALPVSAQLQAAQGNLEMAQQNMETLFNIYHEDAKAKYEYKKDIIETFYNFASEQEKTKLAYAEKMEERTYQEKQSLIKSAEDYAKIALSNNQGVLASKIGALDPTSETYREDLAGLTAQIKDPMMDLDRRIKQAQLNALTAPQGSGSSGYDVPVTKEIDGKTMQWDAMNGKWVAPTKDGGVQNIDPRQQAKAQEQITIISNLLNNPAIKGAVGATPFSQATINIGQKADFISSMENLLSLLTLNTFEDAKKAGATFGAMDKSEWDILAKAATKIGNTRNYAPFSKTKVVGYSMTENSFKEELGRILNSALKSTPEYQYINSIDGAITDGSSLSTDAQSYASMIRNN